VRLSSYVSVLRHESMNFNIFINSLTGISHEIPPGTTLEQVDRSVLDASRNYVCEVRPHLVPPFRDMSDEDLMIARFLIAARKPKRKKVLGNAAQAIPASPNLCM